VATLLEHGAAAAAKNGKGHTTLHVAADVGNAPVLDLLLSAAEVGGGGGLLGARAAAPEVDCLDGDANTPLHFAAEMGHAAAVELLLTRGADPRRAMDGQVIVPQAALLDMGDS
jgi:hypothetical protein